MPRLGAHLSIAGGLPRAVDRAEASGCEALQIFTKSAGQWRARDIPPEEIALFRRRLRQTTIRPVIAHNSYLINVAAADSALRRRSIDALREELDRAESLGLDGLVMHPGSYTSGSEGGGLKLIADALADVLTSRPEGRARLLLEHTAGQGTNLGHRFEHLAEIIDLLGGSARVGVCLDTCHLLAAGYDICSEEGYRETFRHFGRVVGFSRLMAFHLNDSKKPCGSRVDRHEHIGKGCLGPEPFRRILNDPRFAKLPMLLETPKLDTPQSRRRSDIDPLDRMNLKTLRRLLKSGFHESGPNTSSPNTSPMKR
ncbi:MAG TPA: deoxyribonuclease IV [Vicinamibacterales bacterium]